MSVVDVFHGTVQLWYHGWETVSLTPPPPPKVPALRGHDVAPGTVRPLRLSPMVVSNRVLPCLSSARAVPPTEVTQAEDVGQSVCARLTVGSQLRPVATE